MEEALAPFPATGRLATQPPASPAAAPAPPPATPPHSRALRRNLSASLNHLVSGRQQRFRDREAKSFGGLEVDDQIEFCDLLHREVGRLLAFENAPGIDASLVPYIAEAAAIAH